MEIRPTFRRVLTAVLAATSVLTATVASADDYPSRPSRLVIPFAIGATNDLVGRVIGSKLSQRLGQPIVIENKTGSGGTIGADAVAKSRPDGYTLLLGNVSAMVIAPLMYSTLPYVPGRDFIQVMTVAGAPVILVVNPALLIHNLSELIAYATCV